MKGLGVGRGINLLFCFIGSASTFLLSQKPDEEKKKKKPSEVILWMPCRVSASLFSLCLSEVLSYLC